MRYEADEDGRYPLSSREYEALRTLFGAVNALDTENLKNRCKLIKNGWRNLRLAQTLLKRLMEQILTTVPLKKLVSIQKELRYTVCEIKIRPPVEDKNCGTVYVKQEAMVRLADRAINMDCCVCEKSAKECKRCQLFQDLNACFPYELWEPEDTLCPFAGVTSLRLEEKK